jgi:hypothetical protein
MYKGGLRRGAARLARLARVNMPEWVPKALVRAYTEALRSVIDLRRQDRWRRLRGEPESPLLDLFAQPPEALHRWEQRAGLLWRLANYHPDMRGAWDTVMSHPREGTLARRVPGLRADNEAWVSFLIDEIERALRVFEGLPKRSVGERKQGLNQVARDTAALIERIEQDPDASALSRRLLGKLLGVKHHRELVANGEKPFPGNELFPFLSYSPSPHELRGTSAIEGKDGNILPWDKWPAIERHAWVCGAINEEDLTGVLRFFLELVNAEAAIEPPIKRPNSGSPQTRFVAGAVADLFLSFYGSPLDDKVALFVSAALNLPEPLGRDNVRPVVKRARGT